MLKKIGYGLLILLIILIVMGALGIRHFHNLWFAERPNYLSLTYEPKPLKFQWADRKLDDQVESHTAIMLPLIIEGLPHKFYLQFDTGAPTTLIYGKSISSLQSLGIDIQEVQKGENSYVSLLNAELGGNETEMGMIQILEDYGNVFQVEDTLHTIKLGTIGADFLDQRTCLIDFQEAYIQLYEERPDWMDSLQFVPFDFEGRRFMLPATILGKELDLFYDSGTSAFGLITSKNRYDTYTDEDQEEIKYAANRFGESLNIHHKASETRINIGNTDLPLQRISYVDMYADFQRFMTPFTRIGGWLGNKPFIESTMILDTQAEEFVVIKGSLQTP